MNDFTMLIVVLATGLFVIAALFFYLKRMATRSLAASEPNGEKTIKQQLIEKQIAELTELKEKSLIGEDEFKERAKRIFEKI